MKSLSVERNKVFGATLLVAGTTIGAGMLALPLTSAGAGFWGSTLLLIGVWIVMALSALVFLEIILKHGKAASIAILAEEAFGAIGKKMALASIFLLFHALLAAYITGSSQILRGSVMEMGFDLPSWVGAIVYTGLFGFFVNSCVKTVDYANRFLFVLKVFTFLAMTITLMPTTRLENIDASPNLDMIWLALPIFFTSFGFHGNLPSLVDYVGMHHKPLRFVILVGSAIPLVVYLIWQLCTLGSLDSSSLKMLSSKNDISDLVQLLSQAGRSSMLHWMIPTFSFLAISTSFLGVALGLFDVTGETFRKDPKTERFSISLRTFLPPLIFALFYPHGFVMALGYAAIALSFLAVLLPCAIAWKWRQRKVLSKSNYQVAGGALVLGLCMAVGILVIVIEVWKKCL